MEPSVTRFPSVRRFIRASLVGLLFGALACGLTACGAGNNATTAKFYSPADGVSTVVGSLRILNALVVAPPAPGGPAILSMSVANNGTAPERVTRISAAPFGDFQVKGNLLIPPKGVITFGPPEAPTAAALDGFTGVAGASVTLDIGFAVAAPVRRLQVVVVPPSGLYASYVLTPSAAPSPSGTPSATGASASPTGTGTGSPSVTASPSATVTSTTTTASPTG